MLIEVVILIPRAKLDTIARGVPRRTIRAGMMERAAELFGGGTLGAETVEGVWKDDDGGTVVDYMVSLTIGVDGFGALALVHAFARELGRDLGEDSMYIRALGASEVVPCGK